MSGWLLRWLLPCIRLGAAADLRRREASENPAGRGLCAAGSRFISHIWAIKKKVLSMNCPGNMNARMMRFGFDSRTIPSNCFPCRMAARGAGELHRLTGL